MRQRAVALVGILAVVVSLVPLGAGADPATFFPSVELRCRTQAGGRCGGSTQNVEPDVKVDPLGTVYVSAIRGVPGGTTFWRGQTCTVGTQTGPCLKATGIPEYNQVLTPRGYALGGGDTSVATATAPNAGGTYNVYVASLYAAGVNFLTSRDGGVTWESNLLAAPITADRQWIVADGAEEVWIGYKDFGRGSLAVVHHSTDGGRIFGPPVPVYDLDNQSRAMFTASRWSPLEIDRSTSPPTLYWAFSGVETLEEAVRAGVPQNPFGIRKHVLRVAVSRDGGASWADHNVWIGPPTTRVDAVFPWLAIDAAGALYAIWSDTTAIHLSRSADGGVSWSAPVQVSAAPVGAAVFPAAVGGRAGTVDFAYLGTTATSVDDNAADWDVYFAQTLDGGTTFEQVRASDLTIHHGSVCLRGLSCNIDELTGTPANRSLAEVVTIAIDADGFAIIAAPYDQRGPTTLGSAQSLIVKQSGGTRAVDSVLPAIQYLQEPR